MSGYTKVFSSILASTIWQESPATKVVWITMLTMRDKGGVVEASVPGLAKIAGVSIEEAETALAKFLSPDPYSSSPEYEGRRIERVGGGWRILNHYKYLDKMSKDDMRERDRIRQHHHREQKRCDSERVTKRDNRDTSPGSRHKDVDLPQPQYEQKATPFAHSKNEPETASSTDTRLLRGRLATLAAEIYAAYPRKVGKVAALKDIAKGIVTVSRREPFNGEVDLAAVWLKSRVALYANSPQGRRKDKQYIPYPATWFNGGRYDDDPEEWQLVGSVNVASKRLPPRELIDENPSAGFEDILERPKPVWMEGC